MGWLLHFFSFLWRISVSLRASAHFHDSVHDRDLSKYQNNDRSAAPKQKPQPCELGFPKGRLAMTYFHTGNLHYHRR